MVSTVQQSSICTCFQTFDREMSIRIDKKNRGKWFSSLELRVSLSLQRSQKVFE
jgi:hypothetical protein